ncbi:unnamed protein product [Tuber melanosporum]|uniref:(Perigord truffle) hypothetical protein n=1 Tax=Tuber melanosporum (strain Mel28) TaxID=656061 RepID=D5GAJ7_TUBMM|nr:uncharacterized protein GSTUM_00003616001 [Tuber melanosporum]CAZ81540.1 unnamed protein product [Tuber melanosporum]
MFRKTPTTNVTRSLFLPNARRSFLSRSPPLRTLPVVLGQKPPLGPLRAPMPRPLIAHVQPFTRLSPRWKQASKTNKVKSETAKREAELEKVLQEKLEAHPEEVTTTSSMTPIFGGQPKVPPRGEPPDETDMLRGLKSDFHAIKETFALKEVPKEVYYIGLGGTFPYAAISASTLYLAWDINYAHHNGVGYPVSAETAEQVLNFMEPLQVGLGAVILSFLGAVHWGLEMAGYGGKHGYKRYALSILAPALAWPTILLPFDYALITQFLGFTGMYFADSTATGWGWAPPWYMTYRFILTFVVGASIVLSLVGRGQIGDSVSKVPGPASYLQDLRDSQWENLQKEEDERRRKIRRQDAEERKKKAAKTKPKDDGIGGGAGESKVDKQAVDPAERTKGGEQREQGAYSDDKPGASSARGASSTELESTEPSKEN